MKPSEAIALVCDELELVPHSILNAQRNQGLGLDGGYYVSVSVMLPVILTPV